MNLRIIELKRTKIYGIERILMRNGRYRLKGLQVDKLTRERRESGEERGISNVEQGISNDERREMNHGGRASQRGTEDFRN